VILLEFCPKCGKLLIPESSKLICTKCGYTKEISDAQDNSFTEEINHDIERELLKSEVIDESAIDETLPTRELYCPKCEKKQRVTYWQRQTRSADESPTRFFRCVECGHTWREYD